jgi:two-component system response regulator RegA
LVIDHNPSDGERMSREFRAAGFLAAYARPANRLADVRVPFVPKILVVDPSGASPGQCCKSIVLALRDRFPQAAIVVVAHRPSFADCFEAARLGVAAYLPKPAKVSALLASLTTKPLVKADDSANNVPLSLAAHESEQISRALSLCAGNKTAAARILGIPRFTLQRKLNRNSRLK